MVLDADAIWFDRRAVTGIPGAGGAIRALRHPTSGRRPSEEPLMLGRADVQLEADALVPREQRQETVRRRRRDDFDDAACLEAPQCADQIPAE